MSGIVGDNTARASGVIASAGGGGSVVQVVQNYKTDVTTQAGGGYGTFYDISGFSQAITPTKESSKILIDLRCVIGNTDDHGTIKVQADIEGAGYNDIGMPDTSGSRTKGWIGNTYGISNGKQSENYGQTYLWTPSYTLTDVLTVKVLWSVNSGTVVLNRSHSSTNNSGYFIGTSSLTLWEIN